MKLFASLLLSVIILNGCHSASIIRGRLYEINSQKSMNDIIKKIEEEGYFHLDELTPVIGARVYSAYILEKHIPGLSSALERNEDICPHIDKYTQSIDYAKLVFSHITMTDRFGCFRNSLGRGGPPGGDLVVLKIIKNDQKAIYYTHYFSKERISDVGVLISKKESGLLDSPKIREYLSLCDK